MDRRAIYKLSVVDSFSAAHRLVGYQGKCKELHGHNWVVEVTVIGYQLDELGMLVDLGLLKSTLRTILDTLDHKYLNDILETIGFCNPTSENIAMYIASEFVSKLSAIESCKVISLHKVSVNEGPKSQVTLEFGS